MLVSSMVWQLATGIIRRRILQILIDDYTAGLSQLPLFEPRYYKERAKTLSSLSCVCKEWYQAIYPMLYHHYIIVIDSNGQSTSRLSSAFSQFIHTLYIEVSPTLSSRRANVVLSSILPKNSLYGLRTIIIEADLVQRIPTNGTIRGDLTGQLPYMGRNLETVFIKSVNREFRELTSTAAQRIAEFLSSMHDGGQMALVNDQADARGEFSGYIIPAVISSYPTPVSLAFTSVDRVENSHVLIRRAANTLVSLTFLLSSFERFRLIVFGDEYKSAKFPRLRYLCGTLVRSQDEGIGWFSIPEGTFPGLVRVCDKLHFGWQAIAGALPHALINLLMQTDLPSLKLLSTHTSAGMDPVGEHMHNLEEASYSIHPFSPERLNVDIVSAQINHLLLLPYLRKLQVHDQIPTVSIHGLRLELACYGLMYLDLGLITVSFSSTVGILQTLQKLQTLIFAISDLETVVNVGALGDEPLSKSLQTIGMYVIKNKSLIIDNCPSRVILSRLSNIYQVQVQSDSMAVAEYFRSLAQAKAFKWSQSVADQVSVVQTDLFGRAT